MITHRCLFGLSRSCKLIEFNITDSVCGERGLGFGTESHVSFACRTAVYFLDLKSREEAEASGSKTTLKRNRTLISIDGFLGLGKELIDTNSVMGKRDFVYIYVHTLDVDSFSCGRCIDFGRNDLSFFWDHSLVSTRLCADQQVKIFFIWLLRRHRLFALTLFFLFMSLVIFAWN